MSNQDHINAFRSFAGALIIQYSNEVISKQETTSRKYRLHVLDKAMYKMENELNGKVADIIADAENNSSVNEHQLTTGLNEIFNSSIKELLHRNFRG